ncbi:hypothetical protein [Herpetosiphon sp.]|nr:hypothetical protein [Herpetosiphon sp.]
MSDAIMQTCLPSSWIERIKQLLGYTNHQPPTIPWLLVPIGDAELTDAEINQLFMTLRQYLLPSRLQSPLTQIRARLARFTHEDRLVFLYALRLVALRGGGLNRYWTLCCEQLFDSQIDLDNLRTNIAPEITSQWIRFYRETNAALFVPQHGKKNIKWPLAHAGLLVQDKRLLESFWRTMRLTWTSDEFQLLTHSDNIDDLELDLKKWLIDHQFTTTHLYQSIHNSEHSSITLDLIQYYLKELNQQSLNTNQVLSKNQINSIQMRCFRRFFYNHSQNQIELHCTLYFNQPQGKLWSDWDKKLVYWVFDDTFYKYTLNLPINSLNTLISIHVNGINYNTQIDLPIISNDEPVIFNEISGQRLRTWQLGERYLIALPSKSAADPNLQKLFSEYEAAIRPKGLWHDFVFKWVTVRLPSDDCSFIDLNEYATDYDFPVFEAYGTPTVSLLGGLEIGLINDIHYFHADQPPLIKIAGCWNKPLQIQLKKQLINDPSAQNVLQIYLPPQSELSDHFLEPELDSDSEIVFMLSIDGQLKLQWAYTYPEYQSTYYVLKSAVNIVFQDKVQPALTSAILKQSRLQIQAWPHAQLQIVAKSSLDSVTIPLSLDASGFVDLPLAVTQIMNLQRTSFIFWVAWRNIPISPIFDCYQPRMLDPDSIVTYLTEDRLEILMDLPQYQKSINLFAIVLGEYPWENQIWQQIKRIETGSVQFNLRLNPQVVRWLALFEADGQKPGSFLGFYELQKSQPSPAKTPKMTRQWQHFIQLMNQQVLPKRLGKLVLDTQTLDRWATLRQYLLDTNHWIELRRPTIIDTIIMLRAQAVFIPLVLTEHLPHIHTFNQNAHILYPYDINAFQRTMLITTNKIRVYGKIAHNEIYETDITTHWNIIDGEYKLFIDDHSQHTIYACRNCRLILMSKIAHQHLMQAGYTCHEKDIEQLRYPRVYLCALIGVEVIFRQFIKIIDDFIDNKPVGQFWESLFDELSLLMPQDKDIDPLTWLKGLQEIGMVVLAEAAQPTLPSTCQRLFLAYARALELVLTRIKELIG